MYQTRSIVTLAGDFPMALTECQQRLWVFVMTAVLVCGCTGEPSAQRPAGSGSSDGAGPGSKAPGPNSPRVIFIETPITSTSRLVFGGHQWKRDPTGSTAGSEDLPEMGDDGIEDSFTPYVTNDPNLRLFYMLTGTGHTLYVREQDKGKWVTMQKLLFQE
jgi:hypothetical protein